MGSICLPTKTNGLDRTSSPTQTPLQATLSNDQHVIRCFFFLHPFPIPGKFQTQAFSLDRQVYQRIRCDQGNPRRNGGSEFFPLQALIVSSPPPPPLCSLTLTKSDLIIFPLDTCCLLCRSRAQNGIYGFGDLLSMPNINEVGPSRSSSSSPILVASHLLSGESVMYSQPRTAELFICIPVYPCRTLLVSNRPAQKRSYWRASLRHAQVVRIRNIWRMGR